MCEKIQDAGNYLIIQDAGNYLIVQDAGNYLINNIEKGCETKQPILETGQNRRF